MGKGEEAGVWCVRVCVKKKPLFQILHCEIWCFDNIRHFGIFASELKFHPLQIKIKQISQRISMLKEVMLAKAFL